MPATALSTSTSANNAAGFLPPSSSVARVRLAAIAALPTAIPVGTDPVNATLATCGCSINHWPACPRPLTTLNAPAGTPASTASSAMRSSVSGVNSLGLTTMVQPVTRAEAIFQMPIITEKFHGTIPATTPTGSRKVKAV
ncbi:hypothetical protein D3C80_757460 [compost metagenome]